MAAVVPFYNDVLVNNQVGLSRNVDELSEKPKNFLDRVLLPGERVVKEFDCYFPSNFIPRWKLIALLILTCGLYCFVLLKRAIERWCYKHRCCTPAVVEFVRGKLVITDRFRVICWNTRTQQIKTGKGCCCGLCGELCAAPVIFDVDMEHRVYDANKIRQVAMYHSSQALCLFCCMMNESGISISFEEFVDVDGLFISSGSSSKFIHRVRSYLGTVQHYLGLTTNDHTVYITSGQMDAIHQGDSISTVVELSKLQEEILRVLPQQQDILVKNPALKSKDFSLVDDVSGFSMLDENKIRISTKWVHLAPGEQILSACMESYRMSCWDIILSVMTIGLFYLFYVKKRKQVGGILIVTNKRIVEIVTKCKKIGFIPVSLDNAFVSATSYYPGQINGGSMQSRGKNHRGFQNLCCGVICDGGSLWIDFWNGVESLDFAKALQCTPSRIPLMNMPWPQGQRGEVLTNEVAKFLPLMSMEAIRGVFVTTHDWSRPDFYPCCDKFDTPILRLCNVVDPACVDSPSAFCFPWIPYLLTCALRPFVAQQRLIVTDTSVIQFATAQNFGLCGFRLTKECACPVGPCQRVGDFNLTWAPLRSIVGHRNRIHSKGQETFCRRLFKSCSVGKVCCPMSRATYDFGIDVGAYNFSLKGSAPNHNWTIDTSLTDTLLFFSEVQQRMNENPNFTKAIAVSQPMMMMQPMMMQPMVDIEAQKQMERA